MSKPDDRFQSIKDEYESDSNNGTGPGADTVRSRSSLQAFIPEQVKERIESAWSNIRKTCVLSDRDEPMKNDFYTAVLVHGIENMKSVAEHLDLSEAYDEYADVIE